MAKLSFVFRAQACATPKWQMHGMVVLFGQLAGTGNQQILSSHQPDQALLVIENGDSGDLICCHAVRPEGPIIMTGGAIGSLLAQMIHLSSTERKALLVAGATAGMTAIFGTPLAALLLAVELLLFELKPRNFLPVLVAVAIAAAARSLLFDAAPFFRSPGKCQERFSPSSHGLRSALLQAWARAC